MAQAIDDFTIVLPELTDMAACELKASGLDRLWRMVERYKITAPIAIVDTGLNPSRDQHCPVILAEVRAGDRNPLVRTHRQRQ
jgi:hypothetical protein